MPSRVQNLIYALSKAQQPDIATVAASFLRFRKLNMDVHILKFVTENDAPEIGKGNEFATQTYPSHYDVAGRIEKYGSAEFMTWAWAFALGGITELTSGHTYTITPVDPCVTLELPYFSIIQQLCEGGGESIDETYLGCSIEDVNTVFQYGPGRASVRTTVNFNGSGRGTLPSGIVVPATLTEHYMLSQSMAATINGIDYVANKTLLSGTLGWKNNLLLNAGFFPGSGVVNGAAVRGRQEYGARVPTVQFTARLLRTSTEYANLIAQTNNSATLTFTFDATHTVTFAFTNAIINAVDRGETDGIVDVVVTILPIFADTLAHFLTVTAKCGIDGIGDFA